MIPNMFFGNLAGVELFIILFVLLSFILAIVLCVKRAGKLNQSKVVWGLLGFFLNYGAVLILYLLPDKVFSRIDTKRCPYCGEEITAIAKKCKHCGEWLEDK